MEEATTMCFGKNKCGYWYCLPGYDYPCHKRGECFNISNIAAVPTIPVPTALVSAAPVPNPKMKKKKKETITTIDLGGSSSSGSSSSSSKPVTRQTSRDESDEDSDYVFKERKDVDESSNDGNN
jgi:hypothetical protein